MSLFIKKYIISIVILLFIYSCEDSGNIIIDSEDIYGCIDECSLSFDSDATVDNNTCEYIFSYNVDIQPALESHGCIDCHTGLLNGNLDLSIYSGIMSNNTNSGGVINDCLDYESSVILSKIDGGSMGDYASDSLIDMITIWIEEGAVE